jgi:hypothetical protein
MDPSPRVEDASNRVPMIPLRRHWSRRPGGMEVGCRLARCFHR